ncbi:50S ribosomal protein L4 [Candidatus Woesearchaeota archaeon]|nr:50S ribosomal protein L4 [Candidatus Woesearchaeota archaeon]
MKVAVLDMKNARKGEVELPRQFAEPVREDLIKRAVHSIQAAARQPYGADPEAGKRSSAELSRRRRKYRGSYGAGISRVPRKILSRRGTRMYWVGAFAPGTVGGRRAHPPKASKIWDQKVNKRENQKAIRCALSATIDPAIVKERGHKIPASYPFILDSSFEKLEKTADVKKALLALGFKDELARADKTTVRAGKGKMRGRKTKRPMSLLIVTGKQDVALKKAASNIAGVDIADVAELNAEMLAPGTHPGRATLYTAEAIKIMNEEKLFLDAGKKPQASPPKSEPEIKSKKQVAKKKAKTAPKKAKPVPAEPKAAPAAPTQSPNPAAPSPKTGAKEKVKEDKVAVKAPKGEAA